MVRPGAGAQLRRAYCAACAVFFAAGIVVIREARGLDYTTSLGPGPGFLPFWLGVAMVGLTVAWLWQVTLRPVPAPAEGLVPDRRGAMRILSIVIALMASIVLLEVIGFSLVMFAFLLFLLTTLGGRRPVVTVLVSAAGSFGTYWVFRHWLHVYLPSAPIGLLRGLGF